MNGSTHGFHPLLPELIALQQRDRYLRRDALFALSERLGVPINHVYGVATFYRMFRFAPCGKHHIKVCVGAACYVQGAETVFEAFAKELNIAPCSDTSPDGLFTLDRVSCLGCCMLAVAVQIDRHIFGHVTPKTVPHVLADFQRYFQDGDDVPGDPHPSRSPLRAEVRICRCSSCRAAGSSRVYKAVEEHRRKGGFDFAVTEVGCHGMSYRSPLVMVAVGGLVYHYDRVLEHDVQAVLSNHFTPERVVRRAVWKGGTLLDLFYRGKNHECVEITPSSQPADAGRLVTRHSGMVHPESLDEYRAGGGFTAFEKTCAMEPGAVVEALARSKLRGRGGGGFPTGRKWRLALEADGARKYVVCNADEGDPGAFMDRMLLESYPLRVMEGIMIASRVLGAHAAIVYIRDEYSQAIAVLEKIVASLRNAGYLERVGKDFDIVLFRGAGAFVCGEETALLESIQGNRGIPRKRPPFPVTSGLDAVPTLINNVETFACVPVILADGGAAFGAVGTGRSPGTKAFALAGKVRRGGLIEVPIGITVSEIVERYGGGAETGHTVKAVMIGGPSGGCIPRAHFDLPVDYETLQKNGAMMGSGGLVVLDERDCMVDLSLYFLRFLREESCGKCVMCREGVGRLCDLVELLTRDVEKDAAILGRIEALAKHIRQGSLCALGRTAPNMVLSAMHGFRDEFERHVRGACPAGKCTELTEFQVADRCIGCTKCAQHCAAGAIACEPLERAEIITERCVRCGVCRTVCPRGAIVNRRDGDEQVCETDITEIAAFESSSVEGDSILVDGVRFAFRAGCTPLDYAQDHAIDIPTLCHLKGINGNAHCMVCAVWDATLGRFVASCEQPVEPGHVYETRGPHVTAFRREALSLMLYRHDFRCAACSARGTCRFLDLVMEYRAKKEKRANVFPEAVVAKHVIFDAGKCVLCHRCLGVSCGRLGMRQRAEHTGVSPSPGMWDDLPADVARAVCAACPTGALALNGGDTA